MPRPYVLVVDDDPAMRLLLSDLLEEEGYVVRTAADGVDALDLCTRRPPELLITDLRMPRMSGAELVSTLHDRAIRNFPVIILSGPADVMEQARGIAEHAEPKPPNFDRFLRKVHTLTEEHAARSRRRDQPQ